MPNDREIPRPNAQPGAWPDPGAMMNAMQELPETFLLAWQQALAGAPTTWSAQWSMGECRFPGVPQERVSQAREAQGQPSDDRSEPPHQAFSRIQSESLEFWRRSLRAFAKGLAIPTRDERC
jgi:hypothetical protein